MAESINSSTETALSLSNKFGSISKIPEEELAAIGYVRTEWGSIVSAEKLTLAAEQHQRAEHYKERLQPFETIEFSVPASEMQVEVPRGAKLKNFEHLLNNLADLSPDFLETLQKQLDVFFPSGSPLNLMLRKISNFLDQNGEPEMGWSMTVVGLALANLIALPLQDATFLEKPNARFRIVDSMLADSDKGEAAASDVYIELERELGQLADEHSLSKAFERLLADSLALYLEEEADADFSDFAAASQKPKIEQLIADGQLVSIADLLQYGIDGMFREAGFAAIADADPKQLDAVYGHTHDALVEEQRDIKLQLSLATTTEARIELGKKYGERLKELKEQLTKLAQLRIGVAQLHDMPHHAALFFRKSVADLQELLQTGAKKNEPMQIQLDARPNAELDKDPGKVSGDCTEGKPLLFSDDATPLYNVKVYLKGVHRGNIYLLSTVDSHKNPVWHLDAIQIPIKTIDWSSAAGILLEQLAAAAREKGISFITINTDPAQISNYDYIANSITNEVGGDNENVISIRVPQVDDESTHSNLQTEVMKGMARVQVAVRIKSV